MLVQSDLYATLSALGSFIGASLTCELLVQKSGLAWGPIDSVELSRKLIHAVSGVILAVFPWTIHTARAGTLLATLVSLVMLTAFFLFKRHGMFAFFFAKRDGAFWFVLALILCLPLLDKYPLAFSAGFLVLAFADPLATIFGSRWQSPPFFRKSRLGSFTHFIVSTVVLAGLITGSNLDLSNWEIVGLAVLIGALATVTEAVSTRGSDNLLVPVTVATLFQLLVL